MLTAQWRGWVPRLGLALCAGLLLRIVVWGLAARGTAQSWDFANDFPFAGAAVLHHQDPVLTNPGRWHVLPLMPFVLAAELKIGQLAHIGWPVIGKLAPIAADVALIPLVARLAAGNRSQLSAFQYACNPVSIMVCAIHGQWEPVSLALGVGAFLIARSGRAGLSGVLGGLSAATGGWPVLLLPGIWLTLPQWRQRVRSAVWAAAVPIVLLVSSPLTVGTPIGQLPHLARLLIGARSIVGDWGWTAVVTLGEERGERILAQLGKLLLIVALLGTLWVWRRADPVRLTVAVLLAFLIVTPRLGVQYLMFPVPFLLALGGRFAMPAVVTSAAWQSAGYLLLGTLSYDGWLAAHRWWALISVAVIGCLIVAMPWARWERQGTEAPTGVPSPDSLEAPAPVGSGGVAHSGDAVGALPGDG